MNTLEGKRVASIDGKLVFKLSPVAAGCAVFLSALSANVYAQDAQQAADANGAPVEKVVVTGIRRGIEDAISVKKNSTSIVEAISAEDIGKLPDVSIAESIARLPGLAAQRVGGRAQVISVRGLSPDFSTTLLNGREQVSTGDNRSVEFDQYPSELLSGVTIYKTPDASLVGQGLSGTLDMQTVRPLSFGTRTVAMNARMEKNSLGAIANAKSTGNRFSVSYIDQFLDRTLGVAIGFAHLDSPVLTHETGMYEPWKTDSRPGVPANTYIMDGVKSVARSGDNRRDGLMGVLQYRPSRQWTSILDVYASNFHREETANQIEVNLGGWNGGFDPGLMYKPVTTANGVLTGGVAQNVYPLVRGMYNDRHDQIRATGWSNEFTFDGFKLLADMSYSKAERNELSLENNTQISTVSSTPTPFLDNMTLRFGMGGFPTIAGTRDYSNPANLFVRDTIYGSGYGKTPHVDDELKSFKLKANIPLAGDLAGVIDSIDVGVNYSDRDKRKRQPEGSISLKGAPTTIPGDLQYSPVDLSFSGSGWIPAWNVPAVVARYMSFNPSDSASYLISKGWNVKEKITTGFIQANIDHDFGSVSLRGNAGVQVQRADQSSSANYWDGTAAAGSQVKPVNDGKTYTDVLPSLNLAFGLANDQTVRFAAAKQVARPRVDQLRSALDFGVSNVDFKPGGSGGNAQLDPWRANAFDLSYEKYFGKKAYLAAGVFHKKLTSYIYTQTKTYDFSKYIPDTIAKTQYGNYTAPYNGQGGTLKGIELSGSLPLNLVSPMLDGFGVIASATYSDSSIKIQDPSSSIGQDIPLPGLSKHVTNLTVYYEKAGFEARVSQRKRSDFVGEIGNFAADRALRYVVGENVVDMQLGYTFDSGMLKNVGLLLQVNNLTNAAYETYAARRDQQLEYQKYGRTMLVGLNYKF
ncbi:TonB-dependent receptor [Massilia agilis]|uniref:TonB-dependent receptor n=1 Tax=Massilia agilis TaxID=1811226 RepID=A0ABT2D8U7_9BURK|nr:TonB-dependent receptor [Massilia agilis]MCS0807587.1 TonB-dependent receptor [Massilia agilis]